MTTVRSVAGCDRHLGPLLRKFLVARGSSRDIRLTSLIKPHPSYVCECKLPASWFARDAISEGSERPAAFDPSLAPICAKALSIFRPRDFSYEDIFRILEGGDYTGKNMAIMLNVHSRTIYKATTTLVSIGAIDKRQEGTYTIYSKKKTENHASTQEG